jgi:predicted nuclease of predicted toxin-antitoxin system
VIRVLLDQGLPRSAVRHLQDHGIDVCHVADIGLSRASDAEITEHARNLGQLIVTLDADFHRLLSISGASFPSVIRIRREGLRGPDVATLVHQVLDQVGEQLKNGAMVTVTDRNVRLHRLPLRKVASRGRTRSR